MEISTWEEEVYDKTFSPTYDSILVEYKAGKITVEEIENNIAEFNTILHNTSTEGAAKFQYCTAMIDAHQYALAIIKKENTL